MIDYRALATGETEQSVPADGTHRATLEAAKLWEGDNGEQLITEWADYSVPVSWTSWNRFDATGLSYTIELLDGLGVNRAELAKSADNDAFRAALEQVVGNEYEVRTTSKRGSKGDRVFINTYVDMTMGLQESLPVDDRDLPTPRDPKDDPIPF